MSIYYVYQYLREDMTPYYIGKGKNDRAWKSHRRSNGAEIKPKNNSYIQIIKENLTEQEAWDLEIALIAKYKLKSDGGILVNLTYGGEGGSPSQELRKHISKALKGVPKPPRTEQHKQNHKRAAEAMRGKPNPKTSAGLKKYHAANPDRSDTIAKQSASVKEWYKTIDKQAKAWNTWHTRYKNDYDKYANAIALLKIYSVTKVSQITGIDRSPLDKLKNNTHSIFDHFPELRQI